MATAIVPETQQAEVLQFPVTREVIPQGALAQLVELRQAAEAATAAFKAAESLIYGKLENGASVETGIFKAYIHTTPGRRSPAWKDVVVRLADRLHGLDEKQPAGEAYAALVLNGTKPGKPSKKLIVEV